MTDLVLCGRHFLSVIGLIEKICLHTILFRIEIGRAVCFPFSESYNTPYNEWSWIPN